MDYDDFLYMDNTDGLRSTERMYKGVITEVTGGSVTIDIRGRMGQLKIPLKMLIGQNSPKTGDKVSFYMSYPEIECNDLPF
jgi:hypothetical protein